MTILARKSNSQEITISVGGSKGNGLYFGVPKGTLKAGNYKLEIGRNNAFYISPDPDGIKLSSRDIWQNKDYIRFAKSHHGLKTTRMKMQNVQAWCDGESIQGTFDTFSYKDKRTKRSRGSNVTPIRKRELVEAGDQKEFKRCVDYINDSLTVDPTLSIAIEDSGFLAGYKSKKI